jgi:outer membrane protein
MQKNIKFLALLSIVFISTLVLPKGIGAQSLTRVALVDLTKVYTSFFRDSKTVRAFENKAAGIKSEVERLTGELQVLQAKKLEAFEKGDDNLVLSLESDIEKKSAYLKDYYRIKMAELEDEKKRLASSDSFVLEVQGELRKLAEAEGFSIVFDIKDMPGLLWYSQTVDITDSLIQKLRAAVR